jgi:hypothetical protein
MSGSEGLNKLPEPGTLVKVNLESLILDVWVAPYEKPWFRKVVQTVVKTYLPADLIVRQR